MLLSKTHNSPETAILTTGLKDQIGVPLVDECPSISSKLHNVRYR